MSYLTRLHIIDVNIKNDCLDIVNRKLSKHKSVKHATLKYFLDWVAADEDGFLCFRHDDDETDGYVPDDEGLVPIKDAKWYGDETIAGWLKQYSEGGGRIVLHSLEADGGAWGYEFDGKGRMRMLLLKAVGKWS